MSLRKKLLDTFGAQVSSDHERYPADVKCLGFLYLYVGRYPRNNASRNITAAIIVADSRWKLSCGGEPGLFDIGFCGARHINRFGKFVGAGCQRRAVSAFYLKSGLNGCEPRATE